MPWACDRCGTIHTQNPAECRSCGHGIFAPISRKEVARQSAGVDAPEAMADEEVGTMGTAPDPDYDSSPDVAVDGSIAGDSNESPNDSPKPTASGGLWSVYSTLRGFLKAPLGLFGRYLIPILAFVLVFGAVLYLAT